MFLTFYSLAFFTQRMIKQPKDSKGQHRVQKKGERAQLIKEKVAHHVKNEN